MLTQQTISSYTFIIIKCPDTQTI